MLKWAFQRAGYSEEKAVEAFPKLQDWLSGAKMPTISQLQDFASKFFVPFGYMFLEQIPTETIPFPMFRGEAGHHCHRGLGRCLFRGEALQEEGCEVSTPRVFSPSPSARFSAEASHENDGGLS